MVELGKPSPDRRGFMGLGALTVTGFGAAFGLAACCALPFLLAWLGLSSAWLAGIAIFAFYHRSAFLAVALVGLVGAALLLWQQRKSIKPVALIVLAGLLILGMVLFYYGYTMV